MKKILIVVLTSYLFIHNLYSSPVDKHYKASIIGVENMVAIKEDFSFTFNPSNDKGEIQWNNLGSVEKNYKNLVGEFNNKVSITLLNNLVQEIEKIYEANKNSKEKNDFDPHSLSFQVEVNKDVILLPFDKNAKLNLLLLQVRDELKNAPVNATKLECEKIKQEIKCDILNLTNKELKIKNPESYSNVFFCNGPGRSRELLTIKSRSKSAKKEISISSKDRLSFKLIGECSESVLLEMMQFHDQENLAGNYFYYFK